MSILEIDGETVMVSQLEGDLWEVACVECGEVGEIQRDARGYGIFLPGVPRWARYKTLEDAAQVVWEAHRDDSYLVRISPFKLVLAIILVIINVALWGRLFTG